MSARGLRRPSLRRVCVSSVVVALLGTTLLTGAASGRGPDQVIDAGTNAAAAAAAINKVCAEDPEKCTWNNDERVNVDYGPARVIGDVLYNCSTDDPDQEEAETAVGVAQEREETTSLEEEISVEASLSFLDLASSSVKAWAKSNQSESFGTTVEATEATTVPPGYKGWTQASLLSLNVTGSAYITDGIDLIQVTNIDLTYPGYTSPNGDQPVVYANKVVVMTADEEASRCPTTVPTRGTAATEGAAAAQDLALKPRRERFTLTICRPLGDTADSGPRCVRMPVTGRQGPPDRDKVRATLTRGGVTYASERDRTGGIRLVQRRTITPGYYTLTIREKSKPIVVRHRGKKLHEARQEYYVTVPLMIRWFRKG